MTRKTNRAPWGALLLFILLASLGALSCQLTNALVAAPRASELAEAEEVIIEPTETVAIPTALPTAAPVPPTPTAIIAQGNCANNSAFVADVTIPDGTVIAPNQNFTKTWRLSNPSGKCAWGPGYQLVFVTGTAMTPNTAVAVPVTLPGGTADVPVPMTAPSQPGKYSGTWQLRGPGGALFGVKVSVKITTSGPAVASAPTQTATITGTLVAVLPTQVSTPTPTSQPTRTATPASTTAVTRSSTGGTESGTIYILSSGQLVSGGTMLAGDTASNLLGRAYISFDISDLGGKTIASANLDLTSCVQMGTVTNVGGIWVAELQYAVPLVQADDSIADTGIVLLNAKPTSTIDVKSFVQARVSQRKTRFQIRLHPVNAKSNGDKKNDYISCATGVPKLKITYQ